MNLDRMLGLGLGEGGSRVLSQAVQATPASRLLSSADKVADMDLFEGGRKGIVPTTLNLGFGFRISDVDYQKQKLLQQKAYLAEAMGGRSGVRSMDSTYLDYAMLEDGTIPLDVLYKYRVYQDREARLRQMRKELLGQ